MHPVSTRQPIGLRCVRRGVVARSFVGMGGCVGDTCKIDPKPACKAEEMRFVVEEVRACP